MRLDELTPIGKLRQHRKQIRQLEVSPELKKDLITMMDLRTRSDLRSLYQELEAKRTYRRWHRSPDFAFLLGQLRLLKSWFQGWYMGKKAPEQLYRAFKILHQMFPPPPTGMPLWRVLRFDQIDRLSQKSRIRTSRSRLQSWTTQYRYAYDFFRSQYRQGEYWSTDREGRFVTHDTRSWGFVLVKAQIPADWIMCTPATLGRLLNLLWIHQRRLVAAKDYRFRTERFEDAVASYMHQNEVVVWVPRNRSVDLLNYRVLQQSRVDLDQSEST